MPNADFRSEMIVRDSLVHEVDASRFLFGEEVVEVTVLSPAPTSHAGAGVVDPQVSVFRMAGGGLVTNEVFVNSQVGYEVRFEAVAERGSLTAGLASAGVLTTRVAADGGSWGGTVPEDYRRRFARAYDIEVQAWADAVRAGGVVGPVGLGRLRRDGGEHGGRWPRSPPAGRCRSTSPNDRRSTAATTDHGCEPASDHAFHNRQVL